MWQVTHLNSGCQGEAERRSGSINFSRRYGALLSIKNHGFSPGRKGCRCQPSTQKNNKCLFEHLRHLGLLPPHCSQHSHQVSIFLKKKTKKTFASLGSCFSFPWQLWEPGAPAPLLCSIPACSCSYLQSFLHRDAAIPRHPSNSAVALKIFHILLLPGK